MVIRIARDTDADAVFGLTRDMATSFTPTFDAFSSSFVQLLADPKATVLVADVQGSVDGYLLGFTHLTFFVDGPVAWIEEVAVRSDMHRLGLGRTLMGAFEEWAQTRNARLVALATRRTDPFYEALGYERSANYFRKVYG